MTKVETLFVEESPIRSGGRVRVNAEVLKRLEVETEDLIVVSSDKKDILVKIYGDDLIDEDKIRIRISDREKLGVEEDEEVSVRKHQKLLTKLL